MATQLILSAAEAESEGVYLVPYLVGGGALLALLLALLAVIAIGGGREHT